MVTEYPLPGWIGIGHSNSFDNCGLHAPVANTIRSARIAPFDVFRLVIRPEVFSIPRNSHCSMNVTPRSRRRCDQLALSRSGRMDASHSYRNPPANPGNSE